MALAASTCPAASAASELMARGRESAAALEALLLGASAQCPAPQGGLQLHELAAQILRCCDRSLAALHGEVVSHAAAGGCPSRKRRSPPGAAAQMRPKRRGAQVPTRVEKLCTPEDGFLWRKFGKKNIQNSKYPRLYFRCSYKHDNGCMATRQVQQSDDDPSLYIITYFGEHTCGMDAAVAVEDAGKTHQLVINFGSSTASSGSPWPSSSSSDDIQSEASQLLPVEGFPKKERGEQWEKICKKMEPAQALAEPSSSADVVSCASTELEPLHRYFDWDYFGESCSISVTNSSTLTRLPCFSSKINSIHDA